MSTPRIIERKELILNESQTRLVISGWGKDAFDNSVVERITYLSDNLKVKGFISYPKDTSKKYPCLIWNRGGMGNRGAIDTFTARGIYGQMASWGYVVFATQYRGNAGGEGREELGGKDVNDILNLVPLAGEFDFTEKTKWGIEGWSRGGMMTYLALTKNQNFKCAILVGAMTDLKNYFNDSPRVFEKFKELANENKLKEIISERSAINISEKLPRIPYLIIHGGGDKTVSPLQSIEMAKKLHSQNFDYRLVILENGDHFLRNHRKEVNSLRKSWFSKYLV
jgi:dipeptidyl aminopeptidase/acylaminoacyl peptidase